MIITRISFCLPFRCAARLALFGSLALATSAHAEWYVGSDVDEKPALSLDDSNLTGLTANRFDDYEPAVKLYGGYKANDNLALEFGYADAGKDHFRRSTGGRSFLSPAVADDKLDSDSLFLSGIGNMDLTEASSLYFKAGLYNWSRDTTLANVADESPSQGTGTDLFFGLGASLDLTDSFGIRAGWDRYKLDNTDVDYLSTELNYSF